MNSNPQSNKESSKKLFTRIAEIIVFLASLATIASLYIQKTTADQTIADSATEKASRVNADTIKHATEVADRETEIAYLDDERRDNATRAAQGGQQVDLLSTLSAQNVFINDRLATIAPELPSIPIVTHIPTAIPTTTSVPIVDTPALPTQLPSVSEPSTNFGNVTANYSVQDYQDNPKDTVLWNGQLTGVDILNVVDNKWIFSIGFGGTTPILCTSPLTPSIPSTFTIKVSNDKLRFSVRPHNSGNSYVEFWVGESLIYKEIISDKRWYTKELELPSGTEIVLLKHYATNWSWEYLYWSLLE